MTENIGAAVQKSVRLITVSGKNANDGAQLLTKILRSCDFRVSFLGSLNNAWEEALSIASNICDFVVFTIEAFEEPLPDMFVPEIALFLDDVKTVDEKYISLFKNVILPYEQKRMMPKDNKSLLYYSVTNDSADLIAKNINPQQDVTVFELLGTGVIGRVRLPKKSGFSVELVLSVSSALIAMGIPLAAVLNGMNKL